MLLKAKCEISMKKFDQAEKTLQHALNNKETNQAHAKAAFINLYKQWDEKHDIGLKYSLSMLKELTQDSNFETIKKAMRDFMHFFLKIQPRFINEIVSQDILATVLKDMFLLLQQPSNDPEFDSLFERFIEVNMEKSLTDMGKFEDLCKRLIRKIGDPNLKDVIFDKYMRNKENISAWKQIIDILREGNSSPYFGLPSFSFYSLKHGFGFNDLDSHFTNLMNLFKNRQAFFSRTNKGDILFILQNVSNIADRAQKILKTPLPTISEEEQLLMDKNQKELDIDLSKKTVTDVLRYIANLVSNNITAESISHVMRFIKDNEAVMPLE